MDFSNLICYPFLLSLDAASQGISKNIFPFRFKLFSFAWLGVARSMAGEGWLRLRRALAGSCLAWGGNGFNKYLEPLYILTFS